MEPHSNAQHDSDTMETVKKTLTKNDTCIIIMSLIKKDKGSMDGRVGYKESMPSHDETM